MLALSQKVRLLSETHGLDMTLSLLSSPPPRELEHGDEMSPGTLGYEERRTEARSTPVNASKPKALGSQRQADGEGETARGNSPPTKDSSDDDNDDDDTVLDGGRPKAIGLPPASAGSFFFAVPPLPKVKCDTSFLVLNLSEVISRLCFGIPYQTRGVDR